jgi:hypothetical protein
LTSEDGFVAVGHLVQDIAKRCDIKGCRKRPEVMVVIADQAGIIGPDSLVVAATCRPCAGRARASLSHIVVAARIQHDYPTAVRAEIGDGFELKNYGEASS